jgi:4-hydroxy-tetrahydrodipicolinate reductase
MSSSPLRVAVAGALGRMGRMIIEAVLGAPDTRLTGALDLPGAPGFGRDAGEFLGRATGAVVTDSLEQALADADVLIDFTRAEATLRHLEAARSAGVAMVIGTTGFDETGRARIAEAARVIPIVAAPNMSVGVNATLELLAVAARLLSQGYDIEVIEAHHRHKVDAPSGTALRMGEVLAEALGQRLDDVAVHGRHGFTGERRPGSIGFSVIRGGDIVGDHTVLFAGAGERIEITHRATSRQGYAEGSLRAARFLVGRAPGLYGMPDVLGLRAGRT